MSAAGVLDRPSITWDEEPKVDLYSRGLSRNPNPKEVLKSISELALEATWFGLGVTGRSADYAVTQAGKLVGAAADLADAGWRKLGY